MELYRILYFASTFKTIRLLGVPCATFLPHRKVKM
uniref:Uncharacterized protein n=1 Tax=Anguilla anguilla TaxID=7936 RepID=A0A0E9TZG7_ANGAN